MWLIKERKCRSWDLWISRAHWNVTYRTGICDLCQPKEGKRLIHNLTLASHASSCLDKRLMWLTLGSWTTLLVMLLYLKVWLLESTGNFESRLELWVVHILFDERTFVAINAIKMWQVVYNVSPDRYWRTVWGHCRTRHFLLLSRTYCSYDSQD